MAHTPGPWSARRRPLPDDLAEGYEINGPGGPLAYVWGPNDRSNAQLIAAAPALLEAAQALVAASESSNPVEWLGTWGELVTAIVQATGEHST